MKQSTVIKQIKLRMIPDADLVLPSIIAIDNNYNNLTLKTYDYYCIDDEVDFFIDEELDTSKVYDVNYVYKYYGSYGYEESITLSAQNILDIVDGKHESKFSSKDKHRALEKLKKHEEDIRKRIEKEKKEKERTEYEKLKQQFEGETIG